MSDQQPPPPPQPSRQPGPETTPSPPSNAAVQPPAPPSWQPGQFGRFAQPGGPGHPPAPPGYPPAYPPAPPAPPGARRKRSALVASGVALALVAGIGAWFAFSGSDDDGKSSSASPAPPAGASGAAQPSVPPAPKAAPVELHEAWTPAGAGASKSGDRRGGWVGETKVFVVGETGIAVYDSATGAEAAPVAGLPAPLTICESVAQPVGGVGLIGSEGPSGDCDTVFAVDLDQGTVLWTHRIAEFESAWEMALSADGGKAVVAAASSVFAYDLRSGAQLWTWPAPEAGDGIYRDNWDVRDVLVSGANVAVTLQRDDTYSVKYVGGVAVLDTATGALRGEVALDN
ncbi:MAG TPA: hypothetical protein VLH10_11315, partial [Yinghuangia sp.]|nr:hypothetical protein [Yinghuangia sp.]